MIKLLLILMAGLLLEALGVNFLKAGLNQIGAVDPSTPASLLRFAGRALSNGYLLIGVLFETVFFASLIYLLSQADVSLVWPLTSLGFVITTFVARFVQHEQVGSLRWAGVFLITAGALLVGWSEASQKRARPASSIALGDPGKSGQTHSPDK